MNDVVDEKGHALGPVWIKSSFSFANGNCVEVARLNGGHVGVRDSKAPHAGVLRFTAAEWAAFMDGIRNGEFDDFVGQGG